MDLGSAAAAGNQFEHQIQIHRPSAAAAGNQFDYQIQIHQPSAAAGSSEETYIEHHIDNCNVPSD